MPHSPKFSGSAQRNTFFFLFVVWVIYVVLTFMAPADEAIVRYGLTYAQLNLIRATFLIPYLFIWLMAGYAFNRFYAYSKMIKDSPESQSFKRITEGVLLLMLVIIVPPLISLLSAYNPGDMQTEKLVRIFSNYITIIFYLGSFWQLRQGSKHLMEIFASKTQDQKDLFSHRKYVFLFMILLSAGYVYMIFYNQFRTNSADPLIRSTYFLPDPLILLTIVVPYILIWLWGILAIVNLKKHAKNVEGIVYKKAFSNTANGLVAIIGLSISLQFLSQMASFIGKARISVILGIIYILLLVIAIGYFFIARGVRALTAIEEI